MAQLWLVPVEESQYEATLKEPIDLTTAPDKPAEFPDRARVWGIGTVSENGTWKRNRRYFEFMEPGDHLLIYRKRKRRFTASGRVGGIWRTDYVQDNYWADGSATDVVAVEGYQEVDVPRVTVNRILDYDLTYRPQGLSKVANDRPIGRVLTHFALELARNGDAPG